MPPMPSSEWFQRPSDRRLFAFLILNFTVFGVTVTIVGATVPQIIQQFGWGYLAMGGVISAAPVGYMFSTFASGLLVQRFQPRKVLVLGLLAQSVGLGFFGTVPGVFPNLCMTFLMGLGQGSTEVVTDFCVAQMERPGRSRLMNLMHAAFPTGAVLGPLVLGYLIVLGHAWQLLYRGLAIITLAIAAGFCIPRFPLHDEGRGPSGRGKFWELFRDPLLLLLLIVMLLFIGSELGASAWIAEYFVKAFSSPHSVGAWVVSLFWLGVLVGRLSLSVGYRGSRQSDILFALTCSSALFLALFLMMTKTFWAAVLVLFCGLAFSAIYPLVIAIAGHSFQRNQGVAIGTVAMGSGVGSFTFPLIMASIARGYGIETAFWFCVGATLIGALITSLVRVRRRREPRGR